MKFRKTVYAALAFALIIYVYYFYFLASTTTIVTLKSKIVQHDRRYIIVSQESGALVKVRVPEIVWPFLEEGKLYFVNYAYNALRKPYLTRIELSK